VARAKVEELGGVPGVGGDAGAVRLKEAAARQVEREATREKERRTQAAETDPSMAGPVGAGGE
jgi:hypothetical protein